MSKLEEDFGGIRMPRKEWCPETAYGPAEQIDCRRCAELREELAHVESLCKQAKKRAENVRYRERKRLKNRCKQLLEAWLSTYDYEDWYGAEVLHAKTNEFLKELSNEAKRKAAALCHQRSGPDSDPV